MHDDDFLRQCLALAARGQGKVGNGALVGAVLVRRGTVIAEGFHPSYGGAHAERMLLEKFDQKISSDDTLYTSLEPCCHHGKTPPCTDILIERGVKRIVVGMRDPDPRMSGNGIAQLRAAGIDVIGPLHPELCERANRGFVSVRTRARPWITLKQARTKDGRIAKDDGLPLRITSAAQDAWTHTVLRARHDAILVGIGTVLADNPRLDCRLAEGDLTAYQPWRIILDAHVRVPLDARVVADAHAARTIVVAAPGSDPGKRTVLESRGVRIVDVPQLRGAFDWPLLWAALTKPIPGYDGLTSILVEGGRATWEAFHEAGVVDEEITLVGSR